MPAANVTFTAQWTINTFTVTASAGSNGTVTPAGVNSENYGSTPGFSITPAANYHVADVLVDGVSVGAVTSYNFPAITANHTISATFAINTYTLSYTVAANGSITGSSSQTVNSGSNGTLVVALPNSGFHFVSWSDGVPTASRTDLNVTANLSVTATFAANGVAPATYSIVASAGANGNVTPVGTTTVNSGATQSYTITPNAGYSVSTVIVDGAVLSGVIINPITSSYTFSNVSANHTISATFVINTYTLTYTAAANGTITGTTPQTVNSGLNGSTVTAVANNQFHFVSWSDGILTASRTDLNVTSNLSVTANFAANPITTYTLIYTAAANGSITGSTPQTVNSGADGSTVTAVPDIGFIFVSWSDGVLTASRTDLHVIANLSVTANFAIDNSGGVSQFVFTYTAGSGGSISGAASQAVDSFGETATDVTAIANPGYVFTGWSDGFTSATRNDNDWQNDLSGNTSYDISVTANFTPLIYTVAASNGSNGSVTPAGSNNEPYGATPSFTITPAANYHVADVLVDGVSVGAVGNYNFTAITANHTISATFAANPVITFTLTYTAASGGSISGVSPQTVNSGANGSAVSAVANSGFHFTSWSDGNTNASRTDLNVTANLSVTASFAANPPPPPPPPSTFTLVYNAGAGGTISGTTPQPVTSGANGTAVTAIPSTGFHFVSWSDGLLTASRTELNVTSNRSVIATFAANPVTTFTLAYAAGTGGTIGGTTTQVVNSGANGTIVIATPNAGFHFVSWSDGGLTASRTDLNVTSNLSVIATFAADPVIPPTAFTLHYSAGSNGLVTGVASQSVNAGGNGTAVTAVANVGFHFVSWSDGVTTATRTELNVSGNISVTASFAPNGVQPPTNVTTFTLNYVANGHGSISGTTTQDILPGGSGTSVTAIAAAGYHFTTWSDGNSSASRTDSNVLADHTYSANFAQDLVVPITHTIITSSGPNGTVQPLGARVVNDGDTLGVSITADVNYHIANVVVDGLSVGTVSSYDFTNIKADHTISATFAINTNGTPGPGTDQGPIVKEGTDGVSATESGVNDPVILSLLNGGAGVQLKAAKWKIKITSDKKSVYGIKLPVGIKVYLIRGVNGTTSGDGFKPGTIARVYLYSTRIFLGQATVKADGTFSAHFPVSAKTTLGYHVMQVEGTAYDGKFRTAAVGLQVLSRPANGLVELSNIYYDLNVSDLNAANRAKLDAVATTQIANNYSEIWIYGYTDIQTGVNNQVLSKLRAVKVIAYLHKLLPKLLIKYKFFGPANPLNPAKTQAAFAQNRRSEILGKP